MGKTSSEVKARYNKKAYKQWACQIKPDLHERLMTYCQENGLSKSQFLTLAIDTLTKPAQ